MKWETIELSDLLTKTPPKLGNWLRTERARVVGGWLVRTVFVQREAAQVQGAAIEPEFNSSIAMTFVPDANWSWVP